MIRRILHISLFILGVASSPAPVLSASPGKVLGTFQDWQAYVAGDGKTKLCYMASAPQKKEPATAKRGDVLVFVAHRPAEKEQDVVNVQLGYTAQPNSDVRLVIESKPYVLFTRDDTAWTRGANEDKALVQAMMKASSMTVAGESDRGTKTTDTYSLRGFSAAYKEINKACGIK